MVATATRHRICRTSLLKLISQCKVPDRLDGGLLLRPRVHAEPSTSTSGKNGLAESEPKEATNPDKTSRD